MQRRHSLECHSDFASSCGIKIRRGQNARPSLALDDRVLKVLASQSTIVSKAEQKRFAECLSQSLQFHEILRRKFRKNQQSNDIIGLINIARASGELDEANWRCFLAAHFGRSSAEQKQFQSASNLLCAFNDRPYWTWNRVTKNPKAFRAWLKDNRRKLQTLGFGNHRKYESKSPDILWRVFESYRELAEEYGGPAELLKVAGDRRADVDQFDVLYLRLRPLFRFGRTGRFDFLALLNDLNLISAVPTSSYLLGSTGPKQGALRLWGMRKIEQLELLASDFAQKLSISSLNVEDALCNWQK